METNDRSRLVDGFLKYKLHVENFGEALNKTLEKLDQRNVYSMNPAFDR